MAWHGAYEVTSVKLQMQHMHGNIMFITGENIKTWSIMIDSKYTTCEQIEKKLIVFKERIKLRRHSVAFIMITVSRFFPLLGYEEVEVKIFKKFFLKIPVIGCVGGIVCGKNSTDSEEG